MRFKQNKKDGSCKIYFEKHEIKIISKKGYLYLSDIFLRHFGNHLVKIVSDWNMNFSDKVKSICTETNLTKK